MFGNNFFGDEIEDILNRLSGQNSAVEYSTVGPDGKKIVRKRMQQDVFGKTLLNKVITKNKIYFIFDYSGKKDISAEIDNEILEIKENNEIIANFPLSTDINTKGWESNFINGILEVSFKK